MARKESITDETEVNVMLFHKWYSAVTRTLNNMTYNRAQVYCRQDSACLLLCPAPKAGALNSAFVWRLSVCRVYRA